MLQDRAGRKSPDPIPLGNMIVDASRIYAIHRVFPWVKELNRYDYLKEIEVWIDYPSPGGESGSRIVIDPSNNEQIKRLVNYVESALANGQHNLHLIPCGVKSGPQWFWAVDMTRFYRAQLQLNKQFSCANATIEFLMDDLERVWPVQIADDAENVRIFLEKYRPNRTTAT